MDFIELLFLGTGTSTGVPEIGCQCEVCTSSDPRDRRMRPSVLISYPGCRVLVDTTPELRLQCITHGVLTIDAVVYTHAHADHIMGLDDLRKFNVVSGKPLDVWADERTHEGLEKCFSYAFEPPDPASPLFRPQLMGKKIDGPFVIGGQTWTPIKLFHGELPVLGFRVGKLAYCTDVNRIPEESFDLLQDLDILVLDALRRDKHTTHFCLEQAIEAAERIGAKQTLFTHIAHRMGHAETNATLAPNMQLACDGQRVRAGQM
jgi:phosphoribosyl 1,2-cyclic phosphate phosphodiesterase